jgi:hypothetical protein
MGQFIRATLSSLFGLMLLNLAGCGSTSDTSSALVSGTVSFYNGATKGVSSLSMGLIQTQAMNGTWLLTPNQVKVEILKLEFCSIEGDCKESFVSGCEVVFDFESASLTKAIDCEIGYPLGTFDKVMVVTSKTARVLISDSANGIYSNSSTGDLSSTVPAGGAGFINVTAQSGGPSEYIASGFLAESVTITENNIPNLVITGDLSHTILAQVNGGNPTLSQSFDVQGLAVDLLPSVNKPGKIAFYSSYNTAESVRRESVAGSGGEVRVYYDSAGEPRALFLESGNIGGATSGCGGGGASSQAYAIGNGGYLGRDSANTIAWARPQDADWTSYVGVFAIETEQTIIGSTTTIRCKNVSSDPRPVSGNTYASGAPVTTPADEEATVMLVQFSQ